MEDRLRTPPSAPQPRDLLRVAFGPSLVALAVIAAVTLVQLVVANSDLTGTLGAVASMWLAIHQVPVTIAGQQLGVLPLAPAALLVWATARSTAQIMPPRGSWFVARWIVASALGGPLLMAAVALAVIHDAASVITALQTPNALSAFLRVLAVHGLGAVIGVGTKVGRRLLDRLGLPGWLTDTVRPAAIGAAVLLALSTVVVAASLIVHWGTMHELFGITDTFVGQLSLTVLSVLYLPNVVLGAAAVAVGSSAHIGFATFSAFTVFGGDIPAVPILAASPTPPLGPVWVALLIAGAVSGVALGQQCALRPAPLPAALAKLAVASMLAAAGLALLAAAGSGQLGNFGRVGVDQVTFGPAAFVWFFLIGGLTVAMTGGIRPRPRAPKPPREPAALTRSGPAGHDRAGTDETGSGADLDDPMTTPLDLDPVTDRVPTQSSPPAAPKPPPEPPPPPPPVRPAPDAEDVEDLMFVDDDIGAAGGDGPPQPPAGTG